MSLVFLHRHSSGDPDCYSPSSLRGWTGPIHTGVHAGGNFLCKLLSIINNSFVKPLARRRRPKLTFPFPDKTDDESPRPSSFCFETQPFADGALHRKVQTSLEIHILPDTSRIPVPPGLDLTIRFSRLCKAKVCLDQVAAMAGEEAYVWQQGPGTTGTRV